jgi:hypothetical protein
MLVFLFLGEGLLYVDVFAILDNFISEAEAFKPLPLNQSQDSNNTGVAQTILDNHAPIAQNINVTTIRNAPIAFGLNGTDQDINDRLNYTMLTKPVYGRIEINSPTGAVTYSPFGPLQENNYMTIKDIGRDSFTYKVTDSERVDSNVGTVTIISVKTPTS